MAPTMEDRGGACAMVRSLREPHSPPVGPRKGFRAHGEALWAERRWFFGRTATVLGFGCCSLHLRDPIWVTPQTSEIKEKENA
jgi:hypothetical protein